MDEDLLRYSINLARRLGASYAEARIEISKSNAIIFKNGVPEVTAFDTVTGLGIKYIVKGTFGFSATNELSKGKINELLKRSMKTTSAASRLHDNISMSESKPSKARYTVREKIKLLDVDFSEKLKVLAEAANLIKGSGINVPGSYISLADTATEEHFINTDGADIRSIIPRVALAYFITVKQSGRTAQRYWNYGASSGWEAVKKWNIPDMLLSEIKAVASNLKHGVKSPKGVMDVVAAPQVVGIMAHESGGHPYEADRIFGREAAQAGESFITADMIGTRIGSEHVNIVDDSSIPNSYGYFLYDSEGVKARRKVLVKNGYINEFLHNRQTAAELNLPSNGAARASEYDKESIVRMSNTFLLPGNYAEEELIEGVKHGIYIKNFMEWNIDDKRLNQKYVGGQAFLIKNGRLSRPVINPTIEINTPDLYNSVDAVGKNLELHAGNCGKGSPMQAIPVLLGGPSIRLRNIHIR